MKAEFIGSISELMVTMEPLNAVLLDKLSRKRTASGPAVPSNRGTSAFPTAIIRGGTKQKISLHFSQDICLSSLWKRKEKSSVPTAPEKDGSK